MKKRSSVDSVDRILQQWTREKPGIELSAMETIGRLKRCAALINPKLTDVFAEFSLSRWEFDVLATLRRSGAPYCLTPTELFSTLMITSGTMTHRMMQLEKKGWIQRLANEQDARSRLIQLTDSGLAVIDAALPAHVRNETSILDGLTKEDRKHLNLGLKALLAALEN
jgi:DNA-binding MarR family transcriptional regulator